MARLKASFWIWLAGFLALFPVHLTYEVILFGYHYEFLTSDRMDYRIYGPHGWDVVIFGQFFGSLTSGFLIAAVGLWFRNWRIFPPLILGLCAVLWVLQAASTAGYYAGAFGATWLYWEPFRELYYSPAYTPFALFVSLVILYFLTRRKNPQGG